MLKMLMNFIYILLLLILVAFRHKQLALIPSVCQQHLTFSIKCRQKQIFLKNFTFSAICDQVSIEHFTAESISREKVHWNFIIINCARGKYVLDVGL